MGQQPEFSSSQPGSSSGETCIANLNSTPILAAGGTRRTVGGPGREGGCGASDSASVDRDPQLGSAVLIVDDELFNRLILEEQLGDRDIATVSASSAGEALLMLEQMGASIDAILLDWDMRGLSGLELLRTLRASPVYTHIPVILQTGRCEDRDIAAGLKAGAYAYLCKPYPEEEVLRVVRGALARSWTYRSVVSEIRYVRGAIAACNANAEFEFRTIDDARSLAICLGSALPDGRPLAIGLMELFINAIEHGNLDIGFEQKAFLIDAGRLDDEISRRFQLPENQAKSCSARIEQTADETRFVIRDQGKGFDWQSFLVIEPRNRTRRNGRGIPLARTIGFSDLHFNGPGNEVVAVRKLWHL